MLHFYQWQWVVSRASMWIKWGVRISEGQIVQAILYFPPVKVDWTWAPILHPVANIVYVVLFYL